MEFRDQSTVTLIDHMGSDARIVEAARVSTRGEASRGQESDEGLIRYLLRNGHWSPFEHPVATFLIETPLFARSQIIRHSSFSFNEESARYRQMRARFYVPPSHRPLVQTGKPGAYVMEPATAGTAGLTRAAMQRQAAAAWSEYQHLLDLGVTREIARAVLPQHLITSFYMTGSLRSWIHFLSVRDDVHAQYETRMVAQAVRAELEVLFPVAMAAEKELAA